MGPVSSGPESPESRAYSVPKSAEHLGVYCTERDRRSPAVCNAVCGDKHIKQILSISGCDEY